ncbi:MAG: hypothetical protein AAGF25_07400 [Pseudomonadota bacterium]
MKKTLALLTVMSAFAATPAFAADVEFTATVASTCTIDNLNAGSLGVNGDASVLSSTIGTGSSGTADVTANSNLFTLTVTDPSSFEAGAPAVPAGTTWVSSTDFNGSTFGEASPQVVPATTTQATVDLAVTAGSGSFANGSYTALVTLTCS